MTRLFAKTIAGQLRRNVALYVLTLFGVALGVASVVAIQLINQNSIHAFESGIEAVTGSTDLAVEGVGPSISEKVLSRVLSVSGVADAWPVHKSSVLVEGSGPLLEVLGLDLTKLQSLPGKSDSEVPRELFQVGAVAISQTLADEQTWNLEDQIAVSSGSRKHRLQIKAILDLSQLTTAPQARLAIMDIALAQHLFGERGKVHEIGVRLEPEKSVQAAGDQIRNVLGPGYEVLTPGSQQERAAGLLDAFRLNLTALSLISLLVGLFLIYSSTQASLIRRRTEFGLLRSLGATPGQIRVLILGEVLTLALIGVALGIPLGYFAAESRISQVNSTLTNIYLLRGIDRLEVSSDLLILALGIGVGGALAGALLPVLEISRRDTTSLMAAFSLREQISRAARPLFLISLLLFASAAVLAYTVDSAWKPLGFLVGIIILVALPLAAPQTIAAIFGRIPVRGFGLLYSFRSLSDRIQTIAFAVASLTVAISMLIGITFMVASFRETVGVWIETSIAADIYVTSKSWKGAGSSASLGSEVVKAISEFPGVRSADRLRSFPVFLKDRRILFSGVDFTADESRSRYPLVSGGKSAFQTVQSGNAVLISEPLSRKANLSAGDILEFEGFNGPARFPIAGVSYDYASESGLVIMDLGLMNRLFGTGDPNSLALYLENPRAEVQVLDSMRLAFQELPLRFISNRELRDNILKIFDETFAVVRILQWMSLLIAASGVTLTLTILARERVSELALYRALGAQRRQILRLYVGKGMAIASLSSVLGTIGGLLLAAILIFLINRAYFGWTIQIHLPWIPVIAELLTIFCASFLASVYPAIRASSTPARQLSRDDL